MMPPGHVAVAWGVTRLLQRTKPPLATLDYRLLAGAALLPDFIDKPLALWVFTESHSSQNVSHSLLLNVVLLVLTLLFFGRALPYVLAFNSHLIADKMWHHTETFWWPMYGWEVFWRYKFMNTPEAMFRVYVDILLNYPHIWLTEFIAGLILLWFGYKYQWYHWPQLKQFIRTGQLTEWGEIVPRERRHPCRHAH